MVAASPSLHYGETVLTAKSLRLLGAEGLTALLRLRPELLAPILPGSLQHLEDRARSAEYFSLAVRRWNLPTVQIVDALAALGEHADRPALLALLGVTDSAAPDGAGVTDSAAGPDSDPDLDPAVAVVERSLATLDVYGVLVGGGDPRAPRPAPDCRLDPEFAAMWPTRLRLDDPVQTYAAASTVDELKVVVRHLGLAQVQRKADLVRGVVTVLTDPERVRALAADAPPELARRLLDAAHGRTQLAYYGSAYSLRYIGAGGRRADVLEWAMQRFLLVRTPWSHILEMPAEVALALRGPEWTAPFSPHPALCTWVPAAPIEIARAAQAAASGALRELGAVLTDAGARPVPTLKNGAIGVRELRRLAGAVRCTVAEVRLHLALAHRLGLLAPAEAGLAPTDRFDAWQGLPATQRYTYLVQAWLTLPSLPTATDTAWAAEDDEDAVTARRTVLALLAEHPDSTPASLIDLTQRLLWQAPQVIGAPPPSDAELEDLQEDLGPDSAALTAALAVVDNLAAAHSLAASRTMVATVLAEAARLGVVGAGALSPAGAAALTGDDIAAAAGELGSARATARLQADLTAVVLGEPNPQLAAVLDRTADREHLSAAAVWRFSPASIRRALDAGADADDLITQLRAIADGGVPQPLEYLVKDVARRHGRLRGGTVSSYLRSDDEPLLAEIVADRKLTKLKLRRIAPTVVVSTRPLPDVITALRAAGHAPITEGPDGEIVVERQQRHRAVNLGTQRSHLSDVGTDRASSSSNLRDPFGPRRPTDPAAVATKLLARPDGSPDPHGILLHLRDPDTGELLR